MNYMSLIVGIISSSLFTALWSLFFYKQSTGHRGTKSILFALAAGSISFLLSIVIVLPVLAYMGIQSDQLDSLFAKGNFGVIAWLAVSEEFSKLITIWLLVFRHQRITKHMDGILWGGLVGLGFAFVENTFYSLQIDTYSSLFRALFIPILHGGTGAIMGGILAEHMLRDNRRHFHNVWIAIAFTTSMHSLYNYFIVVSEALPKLFFVTIAVWGCLFVTLGYLINLFHFRDVAPKLFIPDLFKESQDEGNTYCVISMFFGLLTLLSIFPLFFGLFGAMLALLGIRKGAKIWGKRALTFAIASLLVSYAASIATYFI